MTRIFGHKWTSIAESDDGTWLAGLQDLTPDNIAIGLGALLQSGDEWPPSLPEFRDCCLGIGSTDGDSWKHKGGAYKIRDQKLIGSIKAEKSTARAEMLKIRKKLNKSIDVINEANE